MSDIHPPQWLTWAREIESLAQTGYYYAIDDYQRERYLRLLQIAAEIVSSHTNLQTHELLDAFNVQKGYITPKIDVRGAVFRDSKLLLVRERRDGGWCMPGGWADVGDTPSEAAEREIFEESGFKTRAIRIIGIYDANRAPAMDLFHAYKLVFLCQLIGGEAQTSLETSDVAFFSQDNIPGAFSGSRTTARHIEDAFKCYNTTTQSTVFD